MLHALCSALQFIAFPSVMLSTELKDALQQCIEHDAPFSAEMAAETLGAWAELAEVGRTHFDKPKKRGFSHLIAVLEATSVIECGAGIPSRIAWLIVIIMTPFG